MSINFLKSEDFIKMGWETVAKDSTVFVMKSGQYELSYDSNSSELQIMKKISHSSDGFYRTTLFLGYCPDEKTFETICKLIKI
jgi:hypothetical protein